MLPSNKNFLQKNYSSSLIIILQKIIIKIKRVVKNFFYQKIHIQKSTFAVGKKNQSQSIHVLFTSFPKDFLPVDSEWVNEVTQHYLSHRFDLLGSGWTRVHHGMNCRGLEGNRYSSSEIINPSSDGTWLRGRINPANLNESQRIWNLIDENYIPIDWHLDFKSGYRWREDTWYKKIQFGRLSGVDVKVPWELSRMQHLTQLCWGYTFASKNVPGYFDADMYLSEFRNQILDFISTNPPQWGVNWVCSMDVAIRVVNWLIAYDLFLSQGAQFDKAFEKIFFRSVYEHGLHIFNNLEWAPDFRSNHYLSDLLGLLFVSVYLPCCFETNKWLVYSVQELINEVGLQFNEDGSNFEASTSYHCLSAELVLYATAVVLGLSEEKQNVLKTFGLQQAERLQGVSFGRLQYYDIPGSSEKSPFPEWYFSRLEGMAEFIVDITKWNGFIPQIGDNDSGKFLKLFPKYRKITVKEARIGYQNLSTYNELSDDEMYLIEDCLDHRQLVGGFNALFYRPDFAIFAGETANVTGQIIANLSRKKQIISSIHSGRKQNAITLQLTKDNNWVKYGKLFDRNSDSLVVTTWKSRTVITDLDVIAYPDFGLYLLRSESLYLAIRCGSIGQNGRGGHAHNDQLSIELVLDNNQILVDPGTYVYTPLPQKRNEFRSVGAHFAPQVGALEPGDLTQNLFTIGRDPMAKVIYFGKKGFIGVHEGYGFPIVRRIEIHGADIIVNDLSLGDKLTQHSSKEILFSPSYGVIQNQIVAKNKTLN